MADVKKTPLISMIRKGERLVKQLLFEYQVKKLGDRKAGGVPDGKDIDAFDANSPRALIVARGEVFRRAPMVGFVAQGNTVAGVSDEFASAVADQLIEHKRDMEKELWSDQESRGDDGVNGSKFRGLGRYVNAGELAFTDSTIIPTGFKTPANQVYTGVLGDGISTGLTEAQLGGMLKARWDNTGDSGDLTLFCSSTVKDRVGLFSRYVVNIAGSTPMVRLNSGVVSGSTLYAPTVDVYQSDWGRYALIPVPTDFLPDQYRAYGLDMTQIALRTREMAKEMNLPDLGGGPREMIRSIIGPEWGDPRAHIKIAMSGP
jgi:hypothetical protein